MRERNLLVVSIDRHLILELAEMQEGVRSSQIVAKGRHHELIQETERGELF